MGNNWSVIREKSTPTALLSICWIALHIGRPIARSLLYPITAYYYFFAKKQRQASHKYLTRIFKRPATWYETAIHIHTFASTILDRVYLLSGQFTKLSISYPEENLPKKYCKNGIGCLLLGSHIGSFEALRSYAVENSSIPIKILMDQDHASMIMRVFNALNSDVASTLIPLDGSPSGLLKVKEIIYSNSIVGLLGDRILDNSSEKILQCTLLGEAINISSAPIIMAAALKVPVIVFFGIYLGGNRYRIHFDLLAEEIILNRATRQQDIQDWTQKYVDLLEQQMLTHPYNWFNFYNYWEKDDE